MCAFLGAEGDYSKAAKAMARAAGWHAHSTAIYWFFIFVTMPPLVFLISFWVSRAPHIRVVRKKHAMKLVIQEQWCNHVHGQPASTAIQVLSSPFFPVLQPKSMREFMSSASRFARATPFVSQPF